MSHVSGLKVQIPAPAAMPNSAHAIGSVAAGLFRLLDAGATSVSATLGAMRPRAVRADLIQAIDELSADRPDTAATLKSTLGRVGNY